MQKYSRSISYKVVSGYILLTVVLLLSFGAIYHEITLLTNSRTEERQMEEKRRSLSQAISCLYRVESISQTLNGADVPVTRYSDYRQSMSAALAALDTLRPFSGDSVQLLRIDSVEMLLKRKDANMRRLLRSTAAIRQERQQMVSEMMSRQDSLIWLQQQQYRLAAHSDSLLDADVKKGFFARLSKAFSRKEKHREELDSLRQVSEQYWSYGDSIAETLRGLEQAYSSQVVSSQNQMNARMQALRNVNAELNAQINTLMYDFEREWLAVSERERMENWAIRDKAAYTILFVACLGTLLAVFFGGIAWRDLQRNNRYRKELEEANRKAAELLALREKLMLTITHDFKAPLSSIIGYTELLSRLLTDDRQRLYLRNVRASSDHLLGLVSQLLDYYRLDAGKMEVNRVTFNPCTLFEEVAATFEPIASKKDLKLIYRKDTSLDRSLIGDPLRIKQIAYNLLSNAVKFTAKGSVTLRLFREADSLCFSVADTGCGIAAADKEAIFKEFTRLPGAQGTDGFGLGLTITRQLTELLQGAIEVRSSEGEGSEFIVRLPLEEASGDISHTALFTEKKRCLLLDDDRLQLDMFAGQLAQLGLEAVCCQRAEEVEQRLTYGKFDILFTDLQMPEMDGITLLTRLRNSESEVCRTIPVVAVSARSEITRSDMRKKGFAAVLRKPFSSMDLATVLREVLAVGVQPVSQAHAGKPHVGGYDFGALTSFAGDDEAASQAILGTFGNETKRQMGSLQRALQEKDAGVIASVAHRWLPLFTMIKAENALPALSRLEQYKQQEWADELDSLTAVVLDEAKRVLAELEKKNKKAG